MDLEAAVVDLNNTVWKHTKHIEQKKTAFNEKATELIAEVTELAQACDKTELFISEMETRLETTAQNANEAEILLYTMLKRAETNLESTRSSLEAAQKRLEAVTADYDIACKHEQNQRKLIEQYTAENASDIAAWEHLLGFSVTLQENGIRIDFEPGNQFTLTKQQDSYMVMHNDSPIDLQFDGSIPRFLLAIKALM